MRAVGSRSRQRGSALLAVLWLSIALSAIAFALSRSVRTELERAGFNVDSTRAYFLARGGIERAMLRMMRPLRPGVQDGRQGFRPGQNFMEFAFASGTVRVAIEGEGGKLDINRAPPQALAQVLAATGLEPGLAVTLAARIAEARSRALWSAAGQAVSTAGGTNVAALSTFSGRRASFQELEELLMIPGVNADILYGTYARNEQGGLQRVGGLSRHLTVWGGGAVDAAYASPQILQAAGMPPTQAAMVVQIRAMRPLQAQDLDLSAQDGPLRLGLAPGSRAYTLRATARLNQGRGVRTVAALVKMAEQPDDPPVRILRWYDVDY